MIQPIYIQPRHLMICLMVISVLGCKSQKSASNAEGNIIEVEKIAEGSFCGVESASNQLISSQAEWESLWRQVTANRSPVPPLPEINFEEKQILACFIGTQNSGGHTALIQEVTVNDEKYQVKVIHTKPGADCFVTDVLTQPYFIGAVSKGKTRGADFSLETVAKPCK